MNLATNITETSMIGHRSVHFQQVQTPEAIHQAQLQVILSDVKCRTEKKLLTYRTLMHVLTKTTRWQAVLGC